MKFKLRSNKQHQKAINKYPWWSGQKPVTMAGLGFQCTPRVMAVPLTRTVPAVAWLLTMAVVGWVTRILTIAEVVEFWPVTMCAVGLVRPWPTEWAVAGDDGLVVVLVRPIEGVVGAEEGSTLWLDHVAGYSRDDAHQWLDVHGLSSRDDAHRWLDVHGSAGRDGAHQWLDVHGSAGRDGAHRWLDVHGSAGRDDAHQWLDVHGSSGRDGAHRWLDVHGSSGCDGGRQLVYACDGAHETED